MHARLHTLPPPPPPRPPHHPADTAAAAGSGKQVLGQVVCTIKVSRDGSVACANVRAVTAHDAQHGVPHNSVVLQLTAVEGPDPTLRANAGGGGAGGGGGGAAGLRAQSAAGQHSSSGIDGVSGGGHDPYAFGLVLVQGGESGESSRSLHACMHA